MFDLEEHALPGTKNFVELQKLEKLQPSELNPKSGFPLHQNRNFGFSELNMLVRFGYQTHLEIRPQPNYRLDDFWLTPSFFPALFPQPNSFFFVVSGKNIRKYEPFCFPRCGILVVILVVILADSFGESSMCRQQTRTPVRGLVNPTTPTQTSVK